jgi:dipeptide/tripeptide permease
MTEAVTQGFGPARTFFGHPIGRAVTTHPAPAAFRARTTALYLFPVGIGTAMSGVLAHYYSREHEIAYFGLTGAATIAVGIVVYFLAPRVSSLMKGGSLSKQPDNSETDVRLR